MLATFVLVHGGGHGGWCYQRVARIMRAQGQDVYTPTMTGLGEREHLLSPAVDLDMHITDIVKVLEFEDLRDVILVGHSYGGMVITGVADRAADEYWSYRLPGRSQPGKRAIPRRPGWTTDQHDTRRWPHGGWYRTGALSGY